MKKTVVSVCPYCEKNESVSIISKNESHIIQGKKVTAKIKVLKCQKCNNEFSTLPMEEKNFDVFENVL